MSEAAKPSEVKIDRLVLDIPGFDPAGAGDLARGIGEQLARSGKSGVLANVSISVDGNTPDLVQRIARALMERLG